MKEIFNYIMQGLIVTITGCLTIILIILTICVVAYFYDLIRSIFTDIKTENKTKL